MNGLRKFPIGSNSRPFVPNIYTIYRTEQGKKIKNCERIQNNVMGYTDRCSKFTADKCQYQFCPIFKILFKALSLRNTVGAAEN